jgi:hypothetical protein
MERLGSKASMDEVKTAFARHFGRIFDFDMRTDALRPSAGKEEKRAEPALMGEFAG